MVIIELSIEIILSIIIPLGGTGLFVIRYFWKKEKCFTLMKHKIEELYKSESGELINDKAIMKGDVSSAQRGGRPKSYR